MTDKVYTIFTDGGCHNERGDLHGRGAWAFVEKVMGPVAVVTCGALTDTTNNRAEMIAIIKAMEAHDASDGLYIISDSGYVVKGITDERYLETWKRNGWRTSAKGSVKNQDLWERIDQLLWRHRVIFNLCKGHNKDRNMETAFWNNMVDMACTHVIRDFAIRDGMVCKLHFDTKTMKVIDKEVYNE